MLPSIDPGLFGSYAFYGGILMVKVFTLAFITTYWRFTKGVFISEEDTKLTKNTKVSKTDPDVERVRAAHQNDMENVFPFFPLGFLYLTTQPSIAVATNVFRIFTFARILHTIVYLNGIKQPARALCYVVALLCNLYMAFNIISFYK